MGMQMTVIWIVGDLSLEVGLSLMDAVDERLIPLPEGSVVPRWID